MTFLLHYFPLFSGYALYIALVLHSLLATKFGGCTIIHTLYHKSSYFILWIPCWVPKISFSFVDSFISIKFEENGVGSWDKGTVSKVSLEHCSMSWNPIKDTNKSVIEHAKPGASLRWRKRIGHLFQLMRWKRSSKVEGVKVMRRKGWWIRSLTKWTKEWRHVLYRKGHLKLFFSSSSMPTCACVLGLSYNWEGKSQNMLYHPNMLWSKVLWLLLLLYSFLFFW